MHEFIAILNIFGAHTHIFYTITEKITTAFEENSTCKFLYMRFMEITEF